MSDTLSDFTGSLNPRTVKVGGVPLVLKEFDMQTRALWLDIAKQYDLQQRYHELQTKVIPKITGIQQDVQRDPRLKILQTKSDKLQEKIDTLMALYGTDDEPDDIEEQIDALVSRFDAVNDELTEATDRIQKEIMVEAANAQEAINGYMEVQDEARVKFVFLLAQALGKVDGEFEDFLARCGGDDYENAERFVLEGNARWASLYEGRMQQKPNKMNLKDLLN